MQPNTIIKNLGICDYKKTWSAMKNFTLSRTKNTANEIWLLEHPPIFTQGISSKPEHILNPGSIPIVQTDRGGQITYHGPGQLIAYTLFDLRRLKIGIKKFVSTIEHSVIELLSEYNIPAQLLPNAPGVYVGKNKICSLGLKICQGSTYHGIALNVHNDLEPFFRINPCGFCNLKMVKIDDFTLGVDIFEVGIKFCDNLLKNLST